MNNQVRVKVFEMLQCHSEWPPTDATECVAWFKAKLAEIPEEHRSTAKIEIEGTQRYGDYYAHIGIYYDRQETDEEMNVREDKDRQHREAFKAQELLTLKVLKAKYEP